MRKPILGGQLEQPGHSPVYCGQLWHAMHKPVLDGQNQINDWKLQSPRAPRHALAFFGLCTNAFTLSLHCAMTLSPHVTTQSHCGNPATWTVTRPRLLRGKNRELPQRAALVVRL